MILTRNLFIILTFCFFNPLFSDKATANTSNKSLSLNTSEIQSLIEKFGPIIYFHPGEKYFPDTVENYVQHSHLICINKTLGKKGMFKRSEKNDAYIKKRELLLSHINELVKNNPIGQAEKDPRIGQAGYNCRIIVNKENKKEIFKGRRPEDDGTITAPAYVNVVERNQNLYVLQFWFFYPYNGPTLGRGPVSVGTHEGDWEHVNVYLSRKTPRDEFELDRVYYAAHGQAQGKMVIIPPKGSNSKSKARLEDGTHPVGYSAQFGHATLPKDTLISENLDSTKKSKYRWDCSKNYQIVAHNGHAIEGQEWVEFLGQYGKTEEGKNNLFTNSPRGPYEKESWARDDLLTYSLIDDLRGYPYLKIEAGKNKTREFIYNCPTRLENYFCVEFFKDNQQEYEKREAANIKKLADAPQSRIPNFKIIKTGIKGFMKKILKDQTVCKSEEAYEMSKNGKNYKYCFKRPKEVRNVKMRFVWADPVKHIGESLGIRMTGFEYTGPTITESEL